MTGSADNLLCMGLPNSPPMVGVMGKRDRACWISTCSILRSHGRQNGLAMSYFLLPNEIIMHTRMSQVCMFTVEMGEKAKSYCMCMIIIDGR